MRGGRDTWTGAAHSPVIFRLRSQVLPTVAMDGAWRILVILSFILPSPDTFTVNGLPVTTNTRAEVIFGGQRSPLAVIRSQKSSVPGMCWSANLMLMM